MADLKEDKNGYILREGVKRLSLRFPVKEISQKLSYDKGNVSNFLKGNKTVPDEFLDNFLTTFGLSRKEILEGVKTDIDKITGYYYPSVSASAGLQNGILNSEVEKVPISIPNWGNDLFFINVYGDSMYPKYCSGEIIGVKEIEPKFVNYGFAYVVVMKDSEVYLKYIRKGKDDSHWILASENKLYDDKEFHISLINKVFIIKGVITKVTM